MAALPVSIHYSNLASAVVGCFAYEKSISIHNQTKQYSPEKFALIDSLNLNSISDGVYHIFYRDVTEGMMINTIKTRTYEKLIDMLERINVEHRGVFNTTSLVSRIVNTLRRCEIKLN